MVNTGAWCGIAPDWIPNTGSAGDKPRLFQLGFEFPAICQRSVVARQRFHQILIEVTENKELIFRIVSLDLLPVC